MLSTIVSALNVFQISLGCHSFLVMTDIEDGASRRIVRCYICEEEILGVVRFWRKMEVCNECCKGCRAYERDQKTPDQKKEAKPF